MEPVEIPDAFLTQKEVAEEVNDFDRLENRRLALKLAVENSARDADENDVLLQADKFAAWLEGDA